jgi:hypothetical protein
MWYMLLLEEERLGEMNGYLLIELVLEFLEADGWVIVVDVLRVCPKEDATLGLDWVRLCKV